MAIEVDIQSDIIRCDATGAHCEGLLCWDAAIEGPRPGILVAPTVRGRSAFEDGRAEELARQGYAALSIDLYGIGTRGQDIEFFRAAMAALRKDRPRLQQKLLDWVALCRDHASVDHERIAAIGYCFGGLCVLDLARTGIDIRGVASFHGILDPPGNTATNRILAKVLALHGWDDPLATRDAVGRLAAELTSMGADWQIHAYGNTLHAFTNPAANDVSLGTVYNKLAQRRSWAAMQGFLGEIFGVRTTSE
jgi:dienelactone hydrolase